MSSCIVCFLGVVGGKIIGLDQLHGACTFVLHIYILVLNKIEQLCSYIGSLLGATAGIENDLSSILQIQRPTTFKQEALALEVRTKLLCIKEAFESSLDENELMKSIESLKQTMLS